MKKIFFTLILLLPISIIVAQNLKMGLYLAPSINSINTNDFLEESSKTSLNYGYIIEYSFTEKHSLESGFEISKKSGEVNTSTENITYKSHYLTLPVQVKMKSRPFGYFTYFAKTGPSLGVKIRENVMLNGGSLDGNSSNDHYGNGKNLILIINVSLGAEYSLKQDSSVYTELFMKNSITKGWKNGQTNTPQYDTFLFNQFGLSFGFLF